MKIYSFPYIANSNAKVLILGTMPGVQSLAIGEYYGNPRNHFWRILFALCHETYSTHYDEKQKLLLKNRIALWDVLQACERKGSLDSAIVQEVPNDFKAFLKAHPHITHIFFNGQQAAKYFKKYITLTSTSVYSLFTLPSTSPANAGISLEGKFEQWSVRLLDCLEY
ncbi:DNA-deoxyinosine glycosylase [Flavobacterium sp.]|uniref:DNA-deoxyinosine glycosylase n=1 Tax=Flavobacterium sp. TaxID=239 RepID=UPI002FDAF6DC